MQTIILFLFLNYDNCINIILYLYKSQQSNSTISGPEKNAEKYIANSDVFILVFL